MITEMLFDRIRKPYIALITLTAGFLLGVLSFIPHVSAFLSLFTYIPFIFLFRELSRGKRVLGLLFAFSFGFYAGGVYWIYRFTVAGIFLVAAYLAVYPLILGFACRLIKKKNLYLFIPSAWMFMEALKQKGPLAYTWNAPGYMASYVSFWGNNAWWGGVSILTLFVIIMNTALFDFILSKRRRSLFFFLFLGGFFLLTGGIARLSGGIGGESKVVSVIQPSISLFEKWDEDFINHNMEIYTELSEMSDKDADLVVWPETAFSAGILWYPPERDTVRAIVSREGARSAHLVGTTHYESGKRYNSLYLVDRSGNYTKYDKVRLLPVAEYIPWEPLYKVLKKIYPIEFNLEGGKDFRPLETEGLSFCAVICFESMFGDYIDSLMDKGGDFLVISTNDGWFTGTPAPRNHLQIAVVRAIEQNSWVVHCANSGISALIDNKGRIYKSLPMGKRGVLNGEVRSRVSKSPYSKFRNITDYLLPMIFMAAAIVLKRKKGHQ